MRTSLVIATLAVVGAGAVSVGATFATQAFNGSDTLYDLTNAAIPAAGLGASGDYQGGGSGAGESNMSSNPPKQWMAPMSKMMTSVTCGAFQGPTHASGVVIGLDAVDIYSSTFSGATSGCSNQSTAGTNGLGLAYSTSIPYTDVNGNAQTLTFQNWTDVLALLYGGLDKSKLSGSGTSQVGISDCDSPQRKALVANWAYLFEANGLTGSSASTCSSNPSSACTTASYSAGSGTLTIGGALWHAFRRDDASGTSDAFAGLIGLGSLYATASGSYPSATVGSGGTASTIYTNSSGAAISYAVSEQKNNGFGITPYCNALNWDTTANNEPSSTSHCALGANKQLIGPGGVPQLFCSVGGAACPSGSTTSTTCNSTGTCQWDGIHRRPPPNTWGDQSFVAASKNIGYDVMPTFMQDNDPIRRTCIGKVNFIGVIAPAEEVCNIDNPKGPGFGAPGQLGLVLPMPEVDWLANASCFTVGGSTTTAACPQFPTTKCNAFNSGGEIAVAHCATAGTSNQVCPDGAAPNGGCQMPGTDLASNNGVSLCENNASKWPTGTDTTQNDGRIFNLVAYNGQATGGPVLFTIPGTSTTVSFTGMFARLHQTLPIWDTSVSSSPPNLPGSSQAQQGCQMTDMTDQIACLTQADPCSVGYAGDGGKLWYQHEGLSLSTAGTDAMEVAQVYPTTSGVQSGTYKVWRKLYYNSSNGFDLIDGGTTYTDSKGVTDNGLAELALGQYESNTASITPLLSTYGFFAMGHSPNGGGNTPFCEDFNEAMLCSGTTTNLNACNFNTNALSVANNSAVANAGGSTAIPSDPSSVPDASTTSTVCGNGVVEAFEDCDWALTPSTCSKTCRTVFP
jgi:hypothetical protein